MRCNFYTTMTLIVMAIPRRRRTYGGGVPMAAAVPMAAYGRLWPPMAAYGRRLWPPPARSSKKQPNKKQKENYQPNKTWRNSGSPETALLLCWQANT
jgi:hypothetical protein